ncbi:MAG: hypothetical protein WBL50_19575 [Candidatus Acidiferrum sp.]
MTDEERRQAQVEALDEVHRLILQEVSKIDANRAHDALTDEAVVCGIHRVGVAVNRLKFAILKKEISLPSIGAGVGGGTMEADHDLFPEMPTGPIPPADPNDLKSAWTMLAEVKKDLDQRFPVRDPSQGYSVDVEHYKRACSPDANVMVVWYRLSQLVLLLHMNELGVSTFTLPEALLADGEPSDAVFKALATVPMTRLEVGVNIEGPPFDIEELSRLIREQEPKVK